MTQNNVSCKRYRYVLYTGCSINYNNVIINDDPVILVHRHHKQCGHRF